MLEKTIKIYKELFDFLETHKEEIILSEYEIERLQERANGHLFGIKLKEHYGFGIDPKTVIRAGLHRFTKDYDPHSIWLAEHGKCHNRTISCEDDKRQPENEMLLCIRFSTGAYMFGDHYPTELFNDFFTELKSYNPKYCDTFNHELYFSLDNAANFYNNFQSILDKYIALDKEEWKKMRLEKLKKELERLENNKE